MQKKLLDLMKKHSLSVAGLLPVIIFVFFVTFPFKVKPNYNDRNYIYLKSEMDSVSSHILNKNVQHLSIRQISVLMIYSFNKANLSQEELIYTNLINRGWTRIKTPVYADEGARYFCKERYLMTVDNYGEGKSEILGQYSAATDCYREWKSKQK